VLAASGAAKMKICPDFSAANTVKFFLKINLVSPVGIEPTTY
jgi:hypothetical protein